ncbi:LYR motif containing protein 1 [Nothobranchius furzeri]|uniref:LYR motif containing 1 n=1 Tax=Nothobranchius kuhntae TaxID=321403 RepID=A0A1A8ITP7_NOTKU
MLLFFCDANVIAFKHTSNKTGYDLMAAPTRSTVLSLYRRVFRIARTWQAQSGVQNDTEAERKYIVQEAHTLFRQNQQLKDEELIRRCLEECEARIEIGLHYRNPYPRASYLPPLGLATQKGRKLRAQQRLRKQAKPIYLQSHDET